MKFGLNKDELNFDRLKTANLLIFGNPRAKFNEKGRHVRN